jgi:hypothetical protein
VFRYKIVLEETIGLAYLLEPMRLSWIFSFLALWCGEMAGTTIYLEEWQCLSQHTRSSMDVPRSRGLPILCHMHFLAVDGCDAAAHIND